MKRILTIVAAVLVLSAGCTVQVAEVADPGRVIAGVYGLDEDLVQFTTVPFGEVFTVEDSVMRWTAGIPDVELTVSHPSFGERVGTITCLSVSERCGDRLVGLRGRIQLVDREEAVPTVWVTCPRLTIASDRGVRSHIRVLRR